jgi:glycerol kinase
MDRALAALPPDGHGLTVLPFLNGERAPSWRDDARAVLVGLTTATRPLDIARAHWKPSRFVSRPCGSGCAPSPRSAT